jgi:hypothetical protein
MSTPANPLVRVATNATKAVEVTFPTRPRRCVVETNGAAHVHVALVGVDDAPLGTDYAHVLSVAGETDRLELPLEDSTVEGGRRAAVYIQAASGTPTVTVWAIP